MNNQFHVETVVISPYDSRIEYKFDDNKIFYHKTLKKNLRFPFNFGIIQNALASNNTPLKNIVYLKENIYPWTYIKTKIIGAIKFQDDRHIYHEKILSVPLDHQEDNIVDLEHFCLEEIKLFIIQYYKVEGIKIKSIRFVDRNEGEKIHNYACSRYNMKKVLMEKRKYKEEKKNIFGHIRKFFKKNKQDISSISVSSSINGSLSSNRSLSSNP